MEKKILAAYSNVQKHAKAVGISRSAVMVLLTLSESDAQCMGELSEHTGITPQGMGRSIQEMKSDGLVSVKPKEDDRRLVIARITAKGRTKVKRILKLWS